MVLYLHDLLSIRSYLKMSQISKPVRVVIELLFKIPYKMNRGTVLLCGLLIHIARIKNTN